MLGSLSGIWQHASTNRTTAVLSIVTLLVLLTAIPLTVLVSRQQQTLKQHAAGENPSVSIAPSACGASPTDTVIIIDRSGSMLGDKITAAKTAAQSFVDILSQNPANKVALVTFSTTATTDAPFTTNYASVKSKIGIIFPSGSTCLECAIKQAEAQIQANASDGNKKVVVLLTDGIANTIAQNGLGTLSMATSLDKETSVLGTTDKKIAEAQFILPTGYVFPTGYSYPSPSPRPSTTTTYPTPSVTFPLPTGKSIFPTGYQLPSGYPTPTGYSGSGGNATQSVAEQRALDAAKASYAAYQTAFYTIGLGGDVNADFLKQLASATGGQYNFSPTGTELTAIYNSLSQVIGKGSVTGFAYNDANGNGTFDTGEQKLPGVQVTLTQGSQGAMQTIATTTSSTTGEFTINGICDGSYILSASPPAAPSGTTNTWHQTSSPGTYAISVTKGSSSGDKNFGFNQGTSSPSLTPTCIPHPTCSPGLQCDANPTPPPGGWCGVSPTISPTITFPPPSGVKDANGTTISLTVLLHGIGAGGDNVSTASSLSNQTPLHPNRGVNVQVFNTSNQMIADRVGTINYSSASGKFTGTIDLGNSFMTGNYNVRVKTDQYLARLLPGIQRITAGVDNAMPPVALIAGDIEGNNALNILDYNILMGCYSDFAPATSCTAAQKQQADINDDGKVNQFDYNLFLRELVVHYGQ